MARRSVLQAFGAATVAALLLGAPVSAAQPEVDVITIDSTFSPPVLSAACGFPVLRHIGGTLVIRTYVDSSGSFVRELDAYRLTETLTANPRTLVGRTIQQIFVDLLPAGGYTVTIAGTDFRLAVPGSGISFGTVGRLVMVFSADDDLIGVTQDVGDVRSDMQAMCSALS